MKFYICKHCGNIITFMENKGVPVMCCGEKMSELIPGSTDAHHRKNTFRSSRSMAATSLSPSARLHIRGSRSTRSNGLFWRLPQGFQRKTLKPGDKPEAVFALTEGDKAVAAYAYCDLHGLWSANV